MQNIGQILLLKDFPSREKYVKTGFPSWKKKWRKIAEERFRRRHDKKFKSEKELNQRINNRAEEILNTMSN